MTRQSVEYGIEDRAPDSSETVDRPRSSRHPDFRRLYSALVFIPFFYALVRHLPSAAFFGLVLVVVGVALTEFYRMHFRERPATGSMALGLGLAGLLLVGFQWPHIIADRMILFAAVSAVLISRLLTVRELSRSVTDSAVLIFGILYVAFTLGHVLLMRALPDGVFLVFFIVLVTWAGDAGAYYVGMRFGQRKLSPVISPNKTIEGLIGGLLLALVAAFTARFWFLPSFTMVDCLATGFLLTVAGVLGDLSESALKRGAGVKDSGVLVPGHGGILDRVDSLLFTIPAFYYYMILVKGT